MLNPNVRYIALNKNGGGLIAITLSWMSLYVEIEEDPAQNGGNLQGLSGNIVDPLTGALTPAAAGAAQWPPQSQPIAFGSKHAIGERNALPVGAPGQTICQLQSLSAANATQVIVREWA